MRVLIVNTSEKTGGAAVAANRLMSALINNGVKAKMLVRDKQTDSLSVVQLAGRWRQQWQFLWERLCIFPHLRFRRANLFKVSIANTGSDITALPEFREADIIHLHWVNQGMLSLKSLRRILQSGKPVVWTLHDMWPVTSICHHSYECVRFESECRDCPFLACRGAADLSHRVFLQKQRLYSGARRMAFVAVSEWLAGRSRRSALMGHLPVTVIPNSISLSSFTITDRLDARSALGIGERYVVSFGAARIDDPIKGFSYLLEALRLLVGSGRFEASSVRLLLFGGVRDERVFGQIPVPYTYLGYVNDDHRLSLVYSASNATVSSSLYETFGQTLIEAMACGSVPVSFDGSGQTDIIAHGQTGYLSRRLSAESLADGIAWALQSRLPAEDLRRSVARRYGESVVANRYIRLYEQLLDGPLPTPNPRNRFIT